MSSTPTVYRGRSVEELIPRIQAELGEDAIVLRRRTGLTGGIGGFFQRQFAEIEAQPGGPRVDLYDENPDTPVLPAPLSSESEPARAAETGGAYAQPLPRGLARPAGAYVAENLAALAAAHEQAPGTAVAEPLLVSQPANGAPQPTNGAPHSAGAASPAAGAPQPFQPESFTAALAAAEIEMFEPLQAELQRIEPSVPRETAPPTTPSASALPQDAATERATSSPSPDHESPSPARETLLASETVGPSPEAAAPSIPAPRGRARLSIESALIDVGISEQFAAELIEAAAAHILPLAPRLSLTRAVHHGLIQSIPVRSPLPAASASIALVGSGGSGKTSCCAALLAAYRKSSTLRASCATIVAEGEEAEYSLLLSPTVMSPTPISAAIAQRALVSAREQGLLLLDTPPLSPADRPAIRRLTALLGELQPDRIVIALPATLSAKAAAQLLEALAPLGASAIAITHADETDQLGIAVEAACQFGLAPEYIVDRGRGRSRLLRIDPTYLADRLLPINTT
jgi:flagellar biosynthesis GTPase FlhF